MCVTTGWNSPKALLNTVSRVFRLFVQERGRCLWNRSLATGFQQVGGLLSRLFCCRTVTEAWWTTNGSIALCDPLRFGFLFDQVIPTQYLFDAFKHDVCCTCLVRSWFSQFCGRIHLRRPVQPLLGKAQQAHRQGFCLQCNAQVEGQWLGTGRKIPIRNCHF